LVVVNTANGAALKMMNNLTIHEQIRRGLTAPGPDATWITRLVWALVNLDEPALEQGDRDIAAAIWPPADYPQYAGHTISWILGQEEQAGNQAATAFCDALAVFLGPDHCINAVSLPNP
jgi:hypothetical protein